MVSKTVAMDTEGNKEPSVNFTRMLNIIAADQVGIMNLIVDAELTLKQNSKVFVHIVRLGISSSREVFQETHVFDHHGH